MSVNVVNPSTGELSRVAGGTLYADAPIGTISPFGGSVIPSGYLLCNGQAVSRTNYKELFAVIGTAFGSGDGSTTFNVPDLREAVPKGTGLSGKTNTHYDADGVALGEFVEDRIESHAHNVYVRDTGHGHAVDATSATNWNQGVSLSMCALNVSPATMYPTTSTGSGNAQIQVNSSADFAGSANSTDTTGKNTNEVKAVGVNYIIKAKQVAVPADLEAQLDVDYQKKDLTSAINIGGVDRTTVELALSSLNDLLKPTITKVNLDPTYATGNCGYFKIGKIVIVLISGISTLVGGSPAVVAGGQLPIPANTGLANTNYHSILKEGASNTAGANYLCWLDPEGSLHVEGVANSPMVYGELIYIAKDY